MQQKLPKPLIFGMLASLATGLLTLFVLKTGAAKKDKLARRAPQLNLDNPGSQDDFPKPPMESEIG
ncbi:MAG TPA: hypothetical protein VM010_08995 [Chitinophagaceae bacterium]|nr:hypothetical protein [Chitinophagaceae bacterium]